MVTKKEKKERIIAGLIGLILLVGILEISTGGLLKSIFPGLNQLELNCYSFDDETLDCVIDGIGSISGINELEQEEMPMSIKNYRGLTYNNFGVYLPLMETIPTYQEFSSINPYCGSNNEKNWFVISDTTQNEGLSEIWGELGVTVVSGSQTCAGYEYGSSIYELNAFSILDKYFQNQLIVMSGTYTVGSQDNPSDSGTFKIAGTCQMKNGNCIFTESNILTGFTDPLWFYPSQTRVNLKIGGFESDDVCIEDGIERCDGENYLVCENSFFVNKGKVDGKCGYEDVIGTCEDEVNMCGGPCPPCDGGIPIIAIIIGVGLIGGGLIVVFKRNRGKK